jgi:hypothetical protein
LLGNTVPDPEIDVVGAGHELNGLLNRSITNSKRLSFWSCVLVAGTILLLSAASQLGRIDKQGALDERLIGAIRRADRESVFRLLAQGADPNARERISRPTGLAARIVSWLHPHGGEPAVMLAVSNLAVTSGSDPSTAILAALLMHGADPCARDPGGKSPAIYNACMYSTEHSVTLLLSAGSLRCMTEDEIGRSIMISDVPKTSALLKFGADANARIGGDLTPLMFAQSVEKVDILLRGGADPYIKDSRGRDTMDWMRACEAGEPGCMVEPAECRKLILELKRHNIEH